MSHFVTAGIKRGRHTNDGGEAYGVKLENRQLLRGGRCGLRHSLLRNASSRCGVLQECRRKLAPASPRYSILVPVRPHTKYRPARTGRVSSRVIENGWKEPSFEHIRHRIPRFMIGCETTVRGSFPGTGYCTYFVVGREGPEQTDNTSFPVKSNRRTSDRSKPLVDQVFLSYFETIEPRHTWPRGY